MWVALKRRYWLLRGWFESRRKDGSRGLYGYRVKVLNGSDEDVGIIVSDRCGLFGHSKVIMRSDGKVQFGGVFRPRRDDGR